MPSPRSPFLATHATVIDAVSAADAAQPLWILILPAGAFQGRDGRGPYDAGDQAAMQAVVDKSLQRAGSTELMVDYDHQSVFGAVPGVGGRAPAAGWIKELQARPDGIYGRVEWTAAAAAAIQAGEYRYVSPVYTHTKAGKVLCLVSAALTNSPNLDLSAVAASAQLTALHSGDNMEPIAQALGLAADADEAACLAAIGVLTAAHAAVIAAAGLAAGASTQDVVVAVQSARASAIPDPKKYVPVEMYVSVQTQLTELQQKTGDDKAGQAVDQVIKDGRMAPAQRDWAMSYAKSDLAAFEAFAAALPVLVRSGGRKEAEGAAKAGDDALSDTDLAVMTALGMSREAFVAGRKKEAI